MLRKSLRYGAVLALVLPTAALAGHGKAGLWNITTVMKMPDMPQLPPEAVAMMKARGITMGGPMASQMCMTEADVKMDTPPTVNNHQMNCTSRIISQTASSVIAEASCHGDLEGVGRSEISWRGDTHYEGSYTFKGIAGGRSQQTSSTFKGDWVKADCGAVKPFSAAAAPGARPPATRPAPR